MRYYVCAIQDRSTYAIDETSSTPGLSTINVTSAIVMGRKVPMCENETMLGADVCDVSVDSVQASANIQELHIKKIAYWLIAIGMVSNVWV